MPWSWGGEEAGANLQFREWQGDLLEHKSENGERLTESKGSHED